MAMHEEEFSVKRMCQALDVGRSGYYAWRHRKASDREQANAELLEKIEDEYEESRKTYGSPRIQAALHRKGIPCGHNRVANLMRIHAITPQKRRKWHVVTTQHDRRAQTAPNHLNQEFLANAPDQKWVCDFTYIPTEEGWLFLAAVIDLFSRKVVGWSMSDEMNTELVRAALQMALLDRHPEPGWLHHSDRGSQYTSQDYLSFLHEQKALCSMSGAGNCYDNAVIESFFKTIKTECCTKPFATREQARTTIFEYIEVWYNHKRLHSTLGYTSPMEFEQTLRH